MKINPASPIGIYKSNMKKPAETHPEGAAVRGEKTDYLSISSQGARQAEAERVTRAVLSEMRPASEARIAQLREAVENKTYYVSTPELANALMTHFGM